MSSHKQTLAEVILARMSFGAVPIDGVYWLDPREAQKAKVERGAQVAQPEPEQCDESTVCGTTPA